MMEMTCKAVDINFIFHSAFVVARAKGQSFLFPLCRLLYATSATQKTNKQATNTEREYARNQYCANQDEGKDKVEDRRQKTEHKQIKIKDDTA
jgi:hypothetical protein